ncbi:MAG: PPC domain-containing protein [Candidatus Hydrogenedentes bacterium]|nr:PPC domain-containing protein [Candidatus Hydrogenedentota bacterium]
MRSWKHAAWCAAIVALLCPTISWAVAPSLSEILPRGAARGGVVEVDFLGANLADASDLIFHDPGIALVEMTAEAGKAHVKINIAPDCRVGTHAIRVRTKTGLTNLRLFSVGALTEVDENEQANNDQANPPVLTVGTTVNGQITNEDADYFGFDLAAGEQFAAEVEGMRLGGPLFDPKLRLSDPAGREIIAEDDTALLAQDAAFVREIKEAGRFTLSVSESAFGGGGGFYYRLHAGKFPRPLAVTPMGGPPGQPINVTWLGDAKLAAQTVTAPAETVMATSVDAITEAGVAPSSVPFRASALPGVLEVEPNNDAATATVGAAPGAFDGVIGETGDIDFYKFEGTAGQVYDVRVYAREMGSPLDSVAVILNPSGSALSSNDDGVGPDAYMRVTLAETGTHIVYVNDHLSRGGATFAYRIEVAPILPKLTFTTSLGVGDFEPANMAVHAGNRNFMLLNVQRQDFDGPLNLAFEGLPQGMTADFDPIVAGQTVVPVVFSAAADAPLAGGLVDVVGKLAQEGTDVSGSLKQDIVLIYGNNKVIFQTRRVAKLASAVCEAAPFSIEIAQPKVPLVQNGTMNLKVVTKRNEGFTAPINLRMLWTPAGVGSGTADIAEAGAEAALFLNAGSAAAAGTYRVAVIGTSSGYTVCTPLTPLMIAAPWVTFDVAKAESEQGKPTELKVVVNQAQQFAGSFNAELLGLPKGCTTIPQPLTVETKELSFPIEIAADAPVGKFNGLFIRTVLKAEEEDVLHQWGSGTLQVFQPLPPAAAPPPTPAATPDQPKPDEPERKTRFPVASTG